MQAFEIVRLFCTSSGKNARVECVSLGASLFIGAVQWKSWKELARLNHFRFRSMFKAAITDKIFRRGELAKGRGQ